MFVCRIYLIDSKCRRAEINGACNVERWLTTYPHFFEGINCDAVPLTPFPHSVGFRTRIMHSVGLGDKSSMPALMNVTGRMADDRTEKFRVPYPYPPAPLTPLSMLQ